MSVIQIIEEYQNIPYPKRPSKPESVVKEKDFANKSDYLYALGDKTKQYETELSEYEIKRKEYTKEQNRVLDLFKKAVIDEAGLSDMPENVQDAAYSYAWQEGHSAGLQEVLNYLLDFSEVIEKAYFAGYHNGSNESQA